VYAQDEYKLRQNFILNLGLRYTVFDLFDEKNGKANPFDFSTCGAQGFCGVGSSFGQQNYGDVDPRVAFAWTPWKGGRTVIRGGFGIYHEDGQLGRSEFARQKRSAPPIRRQAVRSHRFSYPVTSAPEASHRMRSSGTARTRM